MKLRKIESCINGLDYYHKTISVADGFSCLIISKRLAGDLKNANMFSSKFNWDQQSRNFVVLKASPCAGYIKEFFDKQKKQAVEKALNYIKEKE